MKKFKTKIEGSEEEFNFECYENNIPIEIGDKYLFFFGGIADVQICNSENMRFQINKNDRPHKKNTMDLVHNFWRNCYKIKSTNYNLNTIY